MLSFTPSGASAAPATLSDAGDTTGKGSSDDGLFDATYSFLVPATLTAGTLEVAAGSFSGAEFTLYTAETGTTTLDVSRPGTLALSFPRSRSPGRAAHAAVGRPARSPDCAGVDERRRLAGLGLESVDGFPIWLAVVIVVLLAAAVVLFERWRRTQEARSRGGDARVRLPCRRPTPAAPRAPVVVAEPENTVVPEPEPAGTSVSDDVEGSASTSWAPTRCPDCASRSDPGFSSSCCIWSATTTAICAPARS